MGRSLTTSTGAGGVSGGFAARVALVVSRYNRTVTDSLERGALAAFAAFAGAGEAGGGAETASASGSSRVEVFDAAGAFETIALASAAAAGGRFDAVVVLGCIIKGETNHDEVLGHAVTRELAAISRERCLPVGLGVLTVNTQDQALERAGLKRGGTSDAAPSVPGGSGELIGNKGAEAMEAALHTLRELRRLRQGPSAPQTRSDLRSPDKLASTTRAGAHS